MRKLVVVVTDGRVVNETIRLGGVFLLDGVGWGQAGVEKRGVGLLALLAGGRQRGCPFFEGFVSWDFPGVLPTHLARPGAHSLACCVAYRCLLRLLACVFACLLASPPAYLPAYLPAPLPACVLSSGLTFPGRLRFSKCSCFLLRSGPRWHRIRNLPFIARSVSS